MKSYLVIRPNYSDTSIEDLIVMFPHTNVVQVDDLTLLICNSNFQDHLLNRIELAKQGIILLPIDYHNVKSLLLPFPGGLFG